MLEVVVNQICKEFNINDREKLTKILSGHNIDAPSNLEDAALAACEKYGVTLDQLKTNSPRNVYKDRRRRLAVYVNARAYFAKVARWQLSLEVVAIANFLGCHHSTIIYYTNHRKFNVPLVVQKKIVYVVKQKDEKQQKKPKVKVVEPEPVPFVRIKGEYSNKQSVYDYGKAL